jgi:dihydroorotate dehydrogenase electron transfer subunit
MGHGGVQPGGDEAALGDGAVGVALGAVHGEGTAWLADRRRHDPIDIVGPLGRPFSIPRDPINCVLVAGGYGSAALAMLVEELIGECLQGVMTRQL